MKKLYWPIASLRDPRVEELEIVGETEHNWEVKSTDAEGKPCVRAYMKSYYEITTDKIEAYQRLVNALENEVTRTKKGIDKRIQEIMDVRAKLEILKKE